MIKRYGLIFALLASSLIFPIREGFALTSTDSFFVNVSVTGCVSNGVCEPASGETDLNCPSDCACNGNSVCDGSETLATCPIDCHCGNGICDYGENANTCAADCTSNPPPPPPVPPAFAISNVASSGIGQTTAMITWLTSRPGICATNIGMTMDYASSSMVEIGYSFEHQTEIAGLIPGSLYHYSITCFATSTEAPANSGDHVFTTLSGELQPQVNVSDLYAVPDETHVNLYWHNPTNIEFSGVVIRRSLIDYPQVDQGEVVYTGKGNSLASGEATFQDSGLSRSTRYYYSVFAFNANNDFASGAGVNALTLGVSPLGDVSNLRAVAGETNISLYWQNPSSIIFYGVAIRRSTSGYPGVNGGQLIYEGRGNNAESPEVTFNDTGLSTSTLYYYTLFAYNYSRQYSSGAGIQAMTLAGILDNTSTTPATTTPTTTPATSSRPSVGTSTSSLTGKDLIFPDFDVTRGGQTVSGRPDGAVLLQPKESAVISLKGAKALPKTAKMVLSFMYDGHEMVYLFSYDAALDVYSVSMPGLGDIGSFDFTISVFDNGNALLKTIYGRFVIADKDTPFPLAPPIVQEVAKTVVKTYNTISQAAQSDTGKSVAGALVGVAAINAAMAFPWWSWLNMLQFLFTQPFILVFGRRKRWGVVYNSITKKPIDLALVRLYDAITEKLIASKVTDSQGRYLFLVDAGEYKLTVEKPGYSFPSTLLKHVKTDGDYSDVYYGDDMTVGILGKSAIIANIAVDPNELSISDREVLKNISRDHLKRIIGSLGPVFALMYFAFFPSWFSGILVVMHFAMTLVFHRFAVKKVRNYWGHVYDRQDKKPIRQAITRIFSAEYGRMLEYYVTDSQGRYGFLVGANKYYVTGDKAGYETARTREIDLAGKVGEQIIAEDIGLKRISPEKAKETEKTGADFSETEALNDGNADSVSPSIQGLAAKKGNDKNADSHPAPSDPVSAEVANGDNDDLIAVMDSLGTDKAPVIDPSSSMQSNMNEEPYGKRQ